MPRRQADDPGSTLSFYQEALRARRALRGSLDDRVTWLDSPEGALFFSRGSLTCVINCGTEPVPLPPHEHVLIGSAPDGGPPAPSGHRGLAAHPLTHRRTARGEPGPSR